MEKKNKDIPNELVGFKEFIEYDELNGIKNKQKSPPPNFDLLNLLEYESNRLSKAINICEEQTYTLNKFQQANYILDKQEQIIMKNKTIIIELLRRKDSPLTSNLKEIIEAHFSS